ncbi:hypothetical protein [[Mycobacterium] nativiensis]|uniref:DUF1214 domain-containing protein n=1 Tax=[Mycobacterium] nativiensis TaxID=2855503 RepID=A0ABU5XZE2_9MYCO|nr:hypothetical protein [Mycolicibacter sp. MYC340]MEB3033253.1 hypothetical protein [Mycolicibacter sp. MYC340]
MAHVALTNRSTVTREERRHRSRRLVRVAGVAGSMAAGGLAMALTAPHAAAEAAALQGAVAALEQAQASIADFDANNPLFDFINHGASDGMLPQYIQNMSSTTLALLLAQYNTGMLKFPGLGDLPVLNGSAYLAAPFMWNASAADPQSYLIYGNPDNQYGLMPLDPNGSYTITVHPGDGSIGGGLATYSGSVVNSNFAPMESFSFADATPNADGSYTIVVSATDPGNGANWFSSAGATSLLVRDTVGDWGQIHNDVHIVKDGAAMSVPWLNDDQIGTILGITGKVLPLANMSDTYYHQIQYPLLNDPNEFSKLGDTAANVPGLTLPGQVTSLGNFALEPGQALVLKVPELESAYHGLQLTNEWGQNDDFASATGSLNNTQIFQGNDGYTYYILSSENPGYANWVNIGDLTNGGVILRWQDVTGTITNPNIETTVVPISDVKDYLPADMPTVTPQEYAALAQERLLEYGYSFHQSSNINWLWDNLQIGQIKAAIGDDTFDKLFGGQDSVPSILDRMTSAELGPNWAGVFNNMLAHPEGSFNALLNNLPLAIKDVELPSVLAGLQLQHFTEQTFAAMQTSDYWSDSSNLLASFNSFGTILNDALFDPATSISAGLLNARDDLSVALLNATDGTELTNTLWAQLSELNDTLAQALGGSAL